MIDRVVHRIWLDGEMPSHLREVSNRSRCHLSGWDETLWDEERLHVEFPEAAPLVRGEHPAQRSDVYRLLIVARYGGFYMDTDCEIVGDIDHLRSPGFVGLIEGMNDERFRILSYFFGAVPEHRLTKSLIDGFGSVGDIHSRVGWKHFNRHVLLNATEDTSLLGRRSFEGRIVHHFENSWC